VARNLSSITGRTWVFGNDVNTDQIIQGQYLTLLDYSEMAKHAFEIPRPVFASRVKKNDIVVAGRNFGGGSSREEAPRVLLELGVGCIVAESFARIFYRNSFNLGLPLLMIPNVGKLVKDGETASVNLLDGTMRIREKGDVFHGKPLPRRMLNLLEAGGAVEWFKQHRAA
jgi:3-isopropylmalate/(R)-2-methylmalate dehydratase small subunit